MNHSRSRTVVQVSAVLIALAAGGIGFLLLRENTNKEGGSAGRGAFEVTDPRAASASAPAQAPGLGGSGDAGLPGAGAQEPEETPERITRQLAVLDEVARSRNDNDPRLDSELRLLGKGARQELRKRYAALAPERRNERGTIVFLLGRNLRAAQDFAFLKGVLAEPPCLSLSDCSSAPSKVDPHLSDIDERTLAYPSLVALYAVEQLLSRPGLPESERARCREVIEAALRSPVSLVAGRARKLAQSLGR